MMKRYVWVFILSQQTLASVSDSRPTIGTIVRKNIPFALAQSICTIVEIQQQKFEHLSEVKEKLKMTTPSI